jgi:hypothetical protein
MLCGGGPGYCPGDLAGAGASAYGPDHRELIGEDPDHSDYNPRAPALAGSAFSLGAAKRKPACRGLETRVISTTILPVWPTSLEVPAAPVSDSTVWNGDRMRS